MPATTLPPAEVAWTEARIANKLFFDLVRITETWGLGYTGAGSVVAIIDPEGFDATHPDFTGRVILEVCVGGIGELCSNGEEMAEGPGMAVGLATGGYHGTGVAGVVHQFAPDAEFIFINPTTERGFEGSYQWVIDNAEEYGIDALVMAYSHNESERNARREGLDEACPDSRNLDEDFAAMQVLGVVPIAASGNEGSLTTIKPPACLDPTVSVGWVNAFGTIHKDSNVADSLTLLAPSELNAATIPERGLYESFGGTSGAAPVVGALVAIGREINPDVTVDELIATARATGRSIDDYEVEDLRLVDFLAFSQTLAGLPVSPKTETNFQIDAVVSVSVGRKAWTSELCEIADFTLDCSSPVTQRGGAELISGPACIRAEDLAGISPGTCIYAISLQKWDFETGKTVGLVHTKVIQFDVEAIVPIAVIDLNIKVGEVIEIWDWNMHGSFNFERLGSIWANPVFVSGDRSACLLDNASPYSVTGGAPGSCIIEIAGSEFAGGAWEYRHFAINVT